MKQAALTIIKNTQDRVVQLDWFPPNGRSLAPGEEVEIAAKELTGQFNKGTGRMKLDSYLRDLNEGLISIQVGDKGVHIMNAPIKKEIVKAEKLPKASPCRDLTIPVITNTPAAPVINPCLTGQGSVTVVIPYVGDKQLIPINTGTGNFQYAGLIIGQTPVGGGYVGVSVNGLEVFLANGGDGRDTSDCYFSGDNGLTARAMAAIVAGDRLYWNNINAGYPLDTGDLVDFYYMYSTVTPCPV